ncbi:MAG: radical SAM protein, partial [Candidatus Baldrarchaeia archaeon]
KERLDALGRIKEKGFCAGVAYTPILPYISDSDDELENMVLTAKELGVDYVFFSPLTLYGVGKGRVF